MACKDLPFRSAEANAKDYLRKRNIIDKFLNILDLNKFRKANAALTEHGEKGYGIKGQWFYEDLGGTKAVPNKALFKQVDDKNGVYYNKKSGSMLQRMSVRDDIFEYIFHDNDNGELHENSDVIKRLLDNGYVPYHLRDLAKELMPKTGKTLVIEKLDSDAYQQYRHITKQVEVSIENMDDPEKFAKSYLHEVIHHYTASALKDPVSDAQKSFKRNIDRLYESAVSLFNGNKDAHYGLKDSLEFVSEIMTNEKFADALKAKKPSIWQRLVNLVTKLLTGSDVHKEAVDEIMSYIRLVNEKKQGKESTIIGISESKKTSKNTTNSTQDIPEEYRPQFAYYKKSVANAKRDLAKKQRELESATRDKVAGIKAEINALNKYIKETNAALDELKESGNKQILINMAKATIAKIENHIKNANEKDIENVKDNNINRFRHALQVFMDFTPVAGEAKVAYDNLRPLIKKYALAQVEGAIGRELSDKEIEEFEQIQRDIFVGEKNLGTLSSVRDYLGKSIGIMIKKAQSEVTRQNTEAYEELSPLVKGVSDWASKAGVAAKDMYKVFIQQIGNTTMLVKPYTTAYYERINDTFNQEKYTKKEGKAERAKFSRFNKLTKEYEPIDNSYHNKNYEKVQSTPELKAFYDYFKKKVGEISDELPVSLNENFIPNVVEESLMDIINSDRTLMSKMKDGLHHITAMYDVNDKEDGMIFDERTFPDEIPLRYIAKVDPKYKTTDLGDALLKFIQFGNSYREMSEVLPKARLLQDEIKNRSYVKNTNSKIEIGGGDTNIFKMAKTFIDMQVRGMMKNDEKLEKFNYGKAIDFGLKYTSLLRIGLNPFNAVTNVAVGKVGNYIEAMGGRYFNISEYNRAQKIFFAQTMDENSKLNNLIRLFNPLMELEDYENLEKIGIAYLSSQKFQEKMKSLMYLPQKAGEKFLQSSTMVANLMHDKIADKDGNMIPIWDAFTENGEWDTEKMGRELDQDFRFHVTSKVQRINASIHGRYSQKDAAILNQYALFRMVFQFKKWLPAAFESRLQGKRFDDVLGHEIEGRYLTYFKGIKYLYASLKGDLESKELHKFTETDIYNMRKNAAELTIILALTLLGLAMKGAADDDDELKRTGWYKYSMLQLDRVANDLVFFYNPLEVNRSLASGIPLTKTVNDLGRVINNIPHILGTEKDDEFQRGFRSGENKFLASFADIIPAFKQGMDVYRTNKDIPYQEIKSK